MRYSEAIAPDVVNTYDTDDTPEPAQHRCPHGDDDCYPAFPCARCELDEAQQLVDRVTWVNLRTAEFPHDGPTLTEFPVRRFAR